MRVESVMGVVVRGEGMERGRSGNEIVNLMIRVRGEIEGGEGGEVIRSDVSVSKVTS